MLREALNVQRPNVRQYIVNWLLANDDVKLPGGVRFGENSVTIGSTDVQFDADGGLAQQDGTQVASLPNDGSLAIESVETSLPAVGSEITYFSGSDGTDEGFGKKFNLVDGISTTATAIYTRGSGPALNAARLTVYGRRQGSNEQFLDELLYIGFGGVTVVDSQTDNTPDGRTYTDDSGTLDLAMAANTYNVAVLANGLVTDN